MNDRRNYFIALYNDGSTMEQIGKAHNLSRARVSQILKEYVDTDNGGMVLKARINRAENCGCTLQELSKFDAKTIRQFYSQKYSVVKKGIVHRMTLPEWFKIWKDSGHWSEKNKYSMVMKNKNDIFAPHNVSIIETSEYISKINKKNIDIPRGVKKVTKGNYVGYVAHTLINKRDVYIGIRRTPQEAGELYNSYIKNLK